MAFFVKQTVDLIPTGALHPPPNRVRKPLSATT